MLITALVAQWLEHWSRKPGVKSSNLFKGYFLQYYNFTHTYVHIYMPTFTQVKQIYRDQ